MIPKSECVDRHFYKISSRNLGFGVYRASTGGFIGLREKFGAIYLFEEYHHDNGPPYGTVSPKEDLATLPASIELAEGHTECSKCGKPATYVAWPEGGNREVTTSNGDIIRVAGQWQHIPPTLPCSKVSPAHRENKDLREWIKRQGDLYYADKEKHGSTAGPNSDPTIVGGP